MAVRAPRMLNERQLRMALALFFLALTLPAALLFYQAYGQVKWEVFHQHRRLAEELSARIEADVARVLALEESRSFGDYGFLVLAGTPGATFLQRSPLANYPLDGGLAGVVGYFQVDSAGTLSSPSVPGPGTDYTDYGVSASEYRARLALQDTVRNILGQSAPGKPADTPGTVDEGATGAELRDAAGRLDADAGMAPTNVFDRLANVYDAQTERALEREYDYDSAAGLKLDQKREKRSREAGQALQFAAPGAAPAPARRASRKEQVAMLEAVPATLSDVAVAPEAMPDDAAESFDEESVVTGLGQAPEARAESEFAAPQAIAGGTPPRGSPQAKVSKKAAVAAGEKPVQFARAGDPAKGTAKNETALHDALGSRQVRVRLFESEIGPMAFEVLDERHFVLFRNVWRAGERYIQGAVVERGTFFDTVMTSAFRDSALSAMSDLHIVYRGTLLQAVEAHAGDRYASTTDALGGELLYRTRLPAPLSEVEMLYSVAELPLGTGLRYLAWLGFAFLVVAVGGCVAIYRFGIGQLTLYRQQQDFVSAVSHELKTPLTSIRMYSEMLTAGWADEDKKQSYYTFIHDESERLSRLIANVLQLARMNRGNTRLELQSQTVAAVLGAIAPKLASQAEAAGFTLVRSDDAAALDATVELDPDAFTQVLINLVDNAIKFSPDGAKRTIDLVSRRRSDGRVEFSVRDYGAGIAREQMKKIFGLFYRAENELTRETVGTGIGLALVHQLVTRMNGHIDVVNREPGCEFVLTFSARDAPAP